MLLNFFTHSTLFPLTIPMYTKQFYKLLIFTAWIYTFCTLVLSISNESIYIFIKIFFGILSIYMAFQTINIKLFRSFNWILNLISKCILSLCIIGLYLLTNTSKESVSKSVFIYRIYSMVFLGLLVLYLMKNYMYLQKTDNILDKNNSFFKNVTENSDIINYFVQWNDNLTIYKIKFREFYH